MPKADRSQTIKADFAAYTNAPPSYATEQYAGISEAERHTMKKKEYATELSRMMAKQLIRDIESGERT